MSSSEGVYCCYQGQENVVIKLVAFKKGYEFSEVYVGPNDESALSFLAHEITSAGSNAKYEEVQEYIKSLDTPLSTDEDELAEITNTIEEMYNGGCSFEIEVITVYLAR